MIHRTSSQRRPGFTLIEALVVTAILAILFGMTTSAVVRALHSAEDARVLMEIKQIEAAVGTFKAEYGVTYMPSMIRLRNKLSDYFPIAQGGTNNNPDLLDELSRDFFFTMFPRLDKTKIVGWNGNRTDTSFKVTLWGPECLVLFLGGKGGLQGWSKYQLDPWNGPPSGTDNRIRPSFEFNPDRLKPFPHPPLNTDVPFVFPVYFDPYNTGQPYIYFSSRKSGNDYSPIRGTDTSAFENYTVAAPNGQGTDTIRPFYDTKNNRFVNANSFQLICAGRDGLFGQFNVSSPPTTTGIQPNPSNFVQWNNGSFATLWVNNTAPRARSVQDDLANFHPTKLSTPQ